MSWFGQHARLSINNNKIPEKQGGQTNRQREQHVFYACASPPSFTFGPLFASQPIRGHFVLLIDLCVCVCICVDWAVRWFIPLFVHFPVIAQRKDMRVWSRAHCLASFIPCLIFTLSIKKKASWNLSIIATSFLFFRPLAVLVPYQYQARTICTMGINKIFNLM